jgi:hypothetical protein
VTGVTMIPSLSLAIRKRVDSECARTHI